MDRTVETTAGKGARRWWLTTLLVLFLLTFGGIYSLFALGRAHDWVTHTDEVRVVLADLQSTLVDAESGMRGYAVAGEPTFLDRVRSRALGLGAPVRSSPSPHPRQPDASKSGSINSAPSCANASPCSRSCARRAKQGARAPSSRTAMREGGRATDADPRSSFTKWTRRRASLEDARQRDALNRWRWTMVLFIGGAFAFSLVVFTTSLRRREAEARRLRAEEVSRASELFRIVLQGTDLGVTVQDPSGRLVYANDAAARLVGFTAPSELLAAPPAELMARFNLLTFEGTPVSPDQLPGRAALQGHDPEEMRLRFKVLGTKEERWSVVRAVPARDLAGKVIYAINFFRDVTEEIRDGAPARVPAARRR